MNLNDLPVGGAAPSRPCSQRQWSSGHRPQGTNKEEGMKRTVELRGGGISIKATINRNGLTRGELDQVRSSLADKLMETMHDLKWFEVPFHQIQVR